MARSKENLIGAWAFLIGVVLAIIIGLFGAPNSSWPYIILVVLGLVVGFANISDKDSVTFLMASVSLVIVSSLGNNTLIFISNINPILNSLSNVMTSLLVLFVPATIIVALKTVFSIARV